MNVNNVNGTKDLRFRMGDSRFDARTVAVIRSENKLLLQRSHVKSGYAFPGGGCSMNETTKETMERELMEEIGKKIEVKDMIFLVEDFWKCDGEKVHQYAFYYDVEFKDEIDYTKPIEGIEDGKKMYFEWVDIDEFVKEDFSLKPAFLKEAIINNKDNSLKHYIIKEY